MSSPRIWPNEELAPTAAQGRSEHSSWSEGKKTLIKTWWTQSLLIGIIQNVSSQTINNRLTNWQAHPHGSRVRQRAQEPTFGVTDAVPSLFHMLLCKQDLRQDQDDQWQDLVFWRGNDAIETQVRAEDSGNGHDSMSMKFKSTHC